MFDHKYALQTLSATIISAMMLTSTAASSAALSCVNRAVDWNKGGDRDKPHGVTFAAVTLISSGIAGYITGNLNNVGCADPLFLGGGLCLHSDPTSPTTALLSDRMASTTQPFNASNPLPMQAQHIPANDAGAVEFKQSNAIYKFKPACVGELLTGNDQFGNHWTISFQLIIKPQILR